MLGIIKSIKDWRLIGRGEAISYDAPLCSIDGSTGTVVFEPGANVLGCEGNWLIVDGHLWIIKSITPSEDEIVVNVSDPISAFYRSHGWPAGYSTTGAMLNALFTSNYKNQSDVEYAMPYLNITNSDNTPLIKADLKDDIIFVMADYIRSCIRSGVLVDIALGGSGVAVSINTRPAEKRTLVFKDGHSELISQDFSADITSKVTVIVNGVNTFYYLQPDGTISTSAPSPRLPGKWQTTVLKSNQSAQEEAEKIFKNNSASLKLEFYSDKEFPLGTEISFVANDKVQSALISFVGVSSDDNRYHYKAGEMPVTLSDTLKILINNIA